MKKLILTVTVTLACVGAFAQGKVRLENNSLHLLYFTTDTSHLLAADQALAGLATLSNGQGANGTTLAVDLWAGTSSGALAKIGQTSITSGALGGTFTGANYSTVPFTGVGFFQVQVYSLAAGSFASASTNSNQYYGASPVFTSTTSSGVPYFSIVQLTTPASSTWAVGSFDLGANNRGAISLQANIIPEPTTAALAGLALAGLAIFRRRK
jgi:hypothetical protein